MPIYEYHCDTCDRSFETMQRINDPPLESCDQCGSPVRKLLSAPAFQFKGSGWYVTDYAKKGSKGEGSSSSGSDKEKKVGSETDSKSDSSSSSKESSKKASGSESKSGSASSSSSSST